MSLPDTNIEAAAKIIDPGAWPAWGSETGDFPARRELARVKAAQIATFAEARTRAIIAAYDAAIIVTVGEGGRRSWRMNASKLAKAFDLARGASQ